MDRIVGPNLDGVVLVLERNELGTSEGSGSRSEAERGVAIEIECPHGTRRVEEA